MLNQSKSGSLPSIFVPDGEKDDKIKELRKKYRLANKEKLSNSFKEYYSKNKELLKEKRRKYYYNNIELERQKARKRSSTDKARSSAAGWAKNNRAYINEKYKERLESDNLFKLRIRLGNKLSKCLRGKYKESTTLKLLGCTLEEFKIHLELQFKNGMSWDNYGLKGWHIDHIKPCSLFNLENLEEQKKCFHYTNLQPLWAVDNLKKSNKYVK